MTRLLICTKTQSVLLVFAFLKNNAYPFGATYASNNYHGHKHNNLKQPPKAAYQNMHNGLSAMPLLSANTATSATTSTTHYMTKTHSILDDMSILSEVNTNHTHKSLPESELLDPHLSKNGQEHKPSMAKYNSDSPNGRINQRSGEYNASLLSKFLYSYVTPLLFTAQQRPLDVNDTFITPADRQMGIMVPLLESKYYGEKSAALSAIRKASGNYTKMNRLNLFKNSLKKRENNLKDNGDDHYTVSESIVLGKALLEYQKSLLIKTGMLRLLNTLIQAFPALLVARLLRLIEANAPITSSIGAAATLIVVLSMKMIIENQYFHNVLKYATQIRGAISGMIFDKSLRLATDEDGGSSRSLLGVGGMLNLMQSDASILENTAMQLHTVWDGPLQISIYTMLLFRYLGRSVLYGLSILLLTIPTNILLLRILNRMSKYENKAKDARTKRTTETILTMKLLKLQGWERHFEADIEREREEELFRHVVRGAVRALNQAISNAVPAIVLVFTLMAYSRSGAPIVASTIFTSISLFNQLRFPLFFYPMLIDSLANGYTSLRRISSYLAQEEIIPYVRHFPSVYNEGGGITMTNGNFLWSKQGKPALRSANLSVKAGEVVAVIGSVGAGKSALLKALLGELVPMSVLEDAPMVTVFGNIAYCNQEAWVSSGTIKEAVICGRQYNETKYFSAIRDAGLDADLNDDTVNTASSVTKSSLTHNTEVGEGGSSLSGGQRARVALARALYDGDGGVFLLDDVLSALDATVGAIVFERLLSRVKKAKSAAILVTNNPTLPKRCDKIILIGNVDGCASVLDIGTYAELIGRGHDLENISGSKLGRQPKRDNVTETAYEESHTIMDGTISTMKTCHADPDGQKDFECDLNFMADNSYVGGAPESKDYMEPSIEELEEANKGHTQKQGEVMSVDESMSTKGVPLSAYVSYLKSVGSPILVFMTVISYLMVNGAQFYQQLVVAKWTEVGKTEALAVVLRGKYLASITKAAVVVSAFLWLRSFFLMQVGVKASRHLHTNMLRSIIRAPIAFFDATPSGQLVSRFGKELDIVDRSLPDGIGAVLVCFLQILTSTIALAGVVSPGMLVPMISVGYLYFTTTSRFRPAARDLKRTETKTRSPIYTHFKESIKGTEVIRSISGGGRIWSRQHRRLTDENLSVFYTVKSLDRWLSVRLENLGNILVFIGAIVSIFLTNRGRMKSGSAGWGLTQSLAITGLLIWAVRCLTDLESQMMSLIRIQEISSLESTEEDLLSSNKLLAAKEINRIPKEFDTPGCALGALPEAKAFQMTPSPLQDDALTRTGWPWEGRVQLINTSMRYNKYSPLALRSISLDVKPGTTLALVGRSGSGKSSILLTLFRLVEIENGGILIDGIDIRSVGLHALRASLSIIPQDPTLFAGTLMFNLDATGSASHVDAWAALEAASPDLAQYFAGEKGLDTLISEGGKNLSLGQRQLVCLARALLRKDKILILDEATSSVDFKTDAQVQETIRREFVNNGVTVITVAHRLETVFGYDRVAVIGSGSLLEYGAPQDLLRKQNGSFRQLVLDMNRQDKRL